VVEATEQGKSWNSLVKVFVKKGSPQLQKEVVLSQRSAQREREELKKVLYETF